MKGILKKYGAWLAVAGLMASLLGGCQLGGKGTENHTAQASRESETGKEKNGQEAKEGSKEQEAKGRYRETLVDLPGEAEDQFVLQFLKGEGGRLELYTTEKDSQGNDTAVYQYVYEDGTWTKTEDWQGTAAAAEHRLELFCVEYGSDGAYYIGGVDKEDYRYHLLRLEEDGSATKLLEEVFAPREGSTYGMTPPKFQVLDDGNFLLYDYSEADIYDPSGKRLTAMTRDFSGYDRDSRGFCEGGEFVTFLDGSVVRYDRKTGKIRETIACDEVKGGRNGAEILFGDGEGGIYLATEVGLSHVNRGGTMWEVLIDGNLNRMGMRSLSMRGFLEGDEGDFYGVYAGDLGKGIQICHYEYDPDMAAVPPSVLTVYSLEDHSTVRQAASQFQSEHPDIWVEVRTAAEDGQSVTEEMIQGLNTELLSGKGADILILDGLPAASYIEKGVLLDLKDIAAELESSGDMFNNILEGFKEEDGSVHMLPTRMGFPLILGGEKAVSAYSSLKDMTDYQGEKPLIPTDNYGNLLRLVATLQYKELFAEGKGMADRDTLIRYLESVKTLGDAGGSKTVFSQDEMEVNWVSNHVAPTGITGRSVLYDAGRSDSGVEFMDGYTSLLIPAEVRNRNPESKMAAAGDIYIPSSIAGINRSTANADMAKEFIRCLLSYEVQREELYDGLPVNKKALETIVETDRPYSEGVGWGDGYHISAPYPSLEVRREVAAMMDGLTVPVMLDETVMNMVTEGSQNYFDGKESVEQAAEGILRKLSIYLAE